MKMHYEALTRSHLNEAEQRLITAKRKGLASDMLDYNKHIPVDEPCEDCVSREDARSVVAKWVDGIRNMTGALEDIKALPPVTPKQKWIPLAWDESKCNSSFPDDMDGCWAIFTDGKNMSIERGKKDAIDHFFPSGRWFEMSDAVAWMPLPKYKEGGV